MFVTSFFFDPVAGRVWGDSTEATTLLKLLDVFHRALLPGEGVLAGV